MNKSKTFNVNFLEMKKKTEIENNLLIKINQDLQNCFNDINYIKNNCKYFSIFDNEYNFIYDNLYSLSNIEKIHNINQEIIENLIVKLFDHSNKTFWIFQYFYLNKKEFMGINLTGLVNDKMETGLGLRNNIEKLTLTYAKNKYHDFVNFIKSNYIVYKIKSHTFEWNKFNLESYVNFFIIANLDKSQFTIILEK